VPLPVGFRVTLDAGARELAPGVWFGGSPARMMRLTGPGRELWRRLSGGPVDSPGAGALARRLTDAGLAHPCPPPVAGSADRAPGGAPGSVAGAADLTVVVPVRDRAALLGRCLAALGDGHPVVVVDDGSRDPAAVAGVAAAHGATLVRRPVNGGPSAARNTGLEHATTELVAFVDSDCVPSPGWIDRLAGHFADPMVAAVAPRITAIAGPTVAGRYTRAAGSLDMGAQPARVAPGSRVSYVPTAALVARRAALRAVARPEGVFDPAMPVGEDVDLVWRLHAAGWRVRYDPAVRVGHHEPATWPGLLGRRLRYGTSAAPLAVRHPGSIPPLVLHPWPALTVAALLARRPAAAAGAYALSVLSTRRRLRAHGLPTAGVPRMTAGAAAQTWLATGRYATQYASPLLLALLLRGARGGQGGRWGRRAAAASLLLGPPLAGWATRSALDTRSDRKVPFPTPAIDPIRYALAALADDMAYGAGVWAGCVTHRTTAPLRPFVAWRPGKRGNP
jgi:mycofactocin glycosyltransferase